MVMHAPGRIVLIGMMGSGKSTVGRLLAEHLGWRYLDNDEEVRALTERDASDVIRVGGEPQLHAAEVSVFLRALASPRPVVIAAAGGVVMDGTCAARLQEEDHVVYLRARPETLRGRIGTGQGRRSDATDLRWLKARFHERDQRYRRLARSVVDVDERSPAETVDLILVQMGRPRRASDLSHAGGTGGDPSD
jgi:shikimate kinase